MAAGQITQLDKSDVLSGLFATWDALDGLLSGLTEAQSEASTPLPGWSVRDVLAHIIGTESALLGITTPDVDMDVKALEHVRNDVGAMNEHWVRYLGKESSAELRQRFLAVTDERRKLLTGMADDDWNAVTLTPAGQDSYGRFMRIRVFDCWVHEHDIREGVGQPATDAELQGPAPRLALDEMAVSMGFVVGKLGKAPDGSRILIDLTGPLARRIAVVIEGRGRVVDDFGEQEPTATIRLDGLLFTRLAAGRVPTAADGSIEYSGDREVGARIVEHLNYVI